MTDHQRVPLPAVTAAEFDAFYRRALPQVYGYAVRLCGGDEQTAWDLTQEAWVGLVDHLRDGRSDAMTIGWLITAVRSRFVDHWRREERLSRKLRLVWAAERTKGPSDDVSAAAVLSHIDACSPRHRSVLMMAYVDDLPVASVAAELGCSPSKAYALLDRARTELRAHLTGDLP